MSLDTRHVGGAVSKIIKLKAIVISTGLPYTGGLFNTAGLSVIYQRDGAAQTVITPVTAAVGVYTASGFVHAGKGIYEVGAPNNALLGSVDGVIFTADGIADVMFNVTRVEIEAGDPRASLATAANLATLDGKVVAVEALLNPEIQTLLTNLATLTTNVAAVEALLNPEIANLLTNLATLDGKVVTLDGKVVTINNLLDPEIATLLANLATLDGKVVVVDGKIVTLTTNVAAISALLDPEIQTLLTNLAAVAAQLTTVNSLLDPEIADLAVAVAAVSGKVDAVNALLTPEIANILTAVNSILADTGGPDGVQVSAATITQIRDAVNTQALTIFKTFKRTGPEGNDGITAVGPGGATVTGILATNAAAKPVVQVDTGS